MPKPNVITRKRYGADKVSRIPTKIEPAVELPIEIQRKPKWLEAKAPPLAPTVIALKQFLREKGLHIVCEQASCSSILERLAKVEDGLFDSSSQHVDS